MRFQCQVGIPPVDRYEVTARGGKSSRACDIAGQNGYCNCTLDGLLPVTEYTVSVVACFSGQARCGSPILKKVGTLPAREYRLSACLSAYLAWMLRERRAHN